MPECPECGDDGPLFTSETPVGTFHLCIRCSHSICRLCGDSVDELEFHHVSYLFDTGLKVCKDCHHTIHHGDEHDDLEPTITRSRAEEMDIGGTLLN